LKAEQGVEGGLGEKDASPMPGPSGKAFLLTDENFQTWLNSK
jgi:hypothetical protein